MRKNLLAIKTLLLCLLLLGTLFVGARFSLGLLKLSYGMAFIQNKEGIHLVYLKESTPREDQEDNYTLFIDRQGQPKYVNVGKGEDNYIIYRSFSSGEIRRIEKFEYSPVTDNSYFYPYDVYKDESKYDSVSDKEMTADMLADYAARDKAGV